jgi:hypothetical protein
VYWTVFAVVCSLWCASLLLNFLRPIGFDDALYLAATRFVLQGMVPYHDFFFFQPPVFPYVYGAFMKVAGFGWVQAQALSAMFGSGSLLLLVAIAVKQQGRNAALLCVAVGAFSYPMALQLGHFYLVAPGVFFLLLAVYADLCLSNRFIGITLATGALMLAIGTRAGYAPVIPWYLAYVLLVERRRYRALLAFSLSVVTTLLVIWGRVLITDFPRTLFGVTAEVGTMFPMWGVRWSVASLVRGVLEDVASSPVVDLSLLALLLTRAGSIRGFLTESLRGNCPSRFYLLVGGLLAAVAVFSHTASPYYASHHQLYYLPLGVLLVSSYLGGTVLPSFRRDAVSEVLATVLALWLVTNPLVAGGALNDLRALRHRQSADLASVASSIGRLTAPDGQVLAFTPLFAMLAKRPLVRGLESSYVGFAPDWDSATSERFHVFNAEMMLAWVGRRQADLVVITDKDRLAFRNTILSVGPQVWDRFERELDDNYRLVEEIHLDSDYWGNARLYVRKLMS